MAYKLKMDPNDLASMTYKKYVDFCKKEVVKAAKFGETEVVILSDFEFSCKNVGTLILMGKLSGPLLKFYKKQKKERSQEKDFAKGSCVFDKDELGNPVMNIALNDGKGKPSKMLKNGKALFKKIGMTPNIFKGDMLESVKDGDLAEEEVGVIKGQVDDENDHQAMAQIIRQYKKTYGVVVAQIVPMLSNKEAATTLNSSHLELAKRLFALSSSVQNKFTEITKGGRKKHQEFHDKVVAKHDQVRKIAGAVKKILADNADIEIGVKGMEESLKKDIKTLMSELKAHDTKIREYEAAIREKVKERGLKFGKK
ncbi:MAG: Unknown protein [uncultured Sulfurovum sp.]|uniref:Uncharacterized protein n=1 Tax=uncultured Sulfurovum sp. TaxID=269237 RepID=A0A6S6T4T2_9BACT|nr:MAG: Unknown protein [uncultured Sulfurovum sp.]